MFLLLEEMPGKGFTIVVLPAHHCCPCQSFGKMRGWIRETQNCNGTQRRMQWPQEGDAQAPHSGSGWQLGPLALHTPGGQIYGTATLPDPPARLLSLRFWESHFDVFSG